MAILNRETALQQKAALMKGKDADQKLAVNYLVPTGGIMGLLFDKKDEEYDALLNRMVDSFGSYKRALNKIGLDEDEIKEIPPVTMRGYEFEKATLARRGKDGVTRTNLYSITHLFFSASQVFMYSVTLDTISSTKKEITEEYFYKDITNFSTSTESFEIEYLDGCLGSLKKTPLEIQQFGLIVPGDKFYCATFGDIEPQVKAMKNKLREKKM